ncbi:unnamed protein product, partial [Brassica oleracea]
MFAVSRDCHKRWRRATNEKQDPEDTETAAATSYGQNDGGRTHESQKDKKFLEKKKLNKTKERQRNTKEGRDD